MSKKITDPTLFFNNIQGSQSSPKKHVGVILDERLTFCERLKMVVSKINKTIGFLHSLQKPLSKSSLPTIYNAFVKPHLDDGNIINDKAYKASFYQKLEKLQYNACLAITRAIRGTSYEKFYQ